MQTFILGIFSSFSGTVYLRLIYFVSKLKIRAQYINRETHFPYILSTMIYNFVVQRANPANGKLPTVAILLNTAADTASRALREKNIKTWRIVENTRDTKEWIRERLQNKSLLDFT